MARRSLSVWLDGATSSREGYLVCTVLLGARNKAFGEEAAARFAAERAIVAVLRLYRRSGVVDRSG